MDRESFVKKLQEYLDVSSVIGFEDDFLDRLSSDFENFGFKVSKRNGLIHVSKKNDLNFMFCAHVDRHGLVLEDCCPVIASEKYK